MKNAQAKIDALLEALTERASAAIGSLGAAKWGTPPDLRDELEWLIKMSNLNNARVEKTGRVPGPQSKEAVEMTDADLVAQLKGGRTEDPFPRRGPRGKRENVSKPIPPAYGDVTTCAVHLGVVCVPSKSKPGFLVCPDCAQEDVPEAMVSLKALL